MTTQCQVLITGGRVVDPRHEVDEVLTVGITDGRIVHVGKYAIPAERTIDADGLIVAPGFVDLHSHAQNPIGHLLQAHDGVTTSLELECGATPFLHALDAAEYEGRVLNYGYSASWLLARMIVMEGMNPSEINALPTLPLDAFGELQTSRDWPNPSSPEQQQAIIDLIAEQLDDGAIGIGVLLGYAPKVSAAELKALAELAVSRNTTLFVHARFGSGIPGHPAHESVEELIELSKLTGVRIHICHFASSNADGSDESGQLLLEAINRGVSITTESYPFEFASTVIGADFLAPEILEGNGTPASTITYLPRSEVVVSYERLAELRHQDPGGLCLIQYYGDDQQVGVDQLLKALSFPGAAFASDAMPLTTVGSTGSETTLPTTLPVPEGFAAHPRSSSCFIRALTWLHRDTGLMNLSEVISRSSDIPARILSNCAPVFNDKGHLGVGSDADIVIFDLDSAMPRTNPAPVEPAIGVVHLFVNGELLVENGTLQAISPGKALLNGATTTQRGVHG
ncbi:amidohydrolase family protein [Brevibacterium sp. ZH18]|uniref:amidohydrolase family protein n=1 Tax=Brevibacterium sp. ZH18 TaxID=2927784 RepID=UPI001F623B92|nr:amidohydrolase family protein [Brevibacterium sp. ZH18]MCI4011120.1 amidohydrolase family protein [Brevibacterium sp. ZH18]